MSESPLKLPNDPKLKQAVRDVMEATDDHTVIALRVRAARLLYDTMDTPDIDLMCATIMHRLVDDETLLKNHDQSVIDVCDTILEEVYGATLDELADFSKRYKAFYAAINAVGLEMILELDTGRTKSLSNMYRDTDDMMQIFGTTGYEELDEYVELMLDLAEETLMLSDDPEHGSTNGGAAVRVPPQGADMKKWVSKNGRKLF